MTPQSQFDYSFSVWPQEKWGFESSMFKLFEMFNGRVEMTFSEREFEDFRSSLSHHGLTLREIERTPHQEPELVY